VRTLFIAIIVAYKNASLAPLRVHRPFSDSRRESHFMRIGNAVRRGHRLGILPRLVLVLLSCATAACAQPRGDAREPAGCSVQAIVALQLDPTPSLLAELGRASGARLELVRTMTTNLHLISLTAPGGEAECVAAIEQLRRDSRVRSVDVDQRRQIQ
jgi:hypothetical protein